MTGKKTNQLETYHALHDGLSERIESGRLREDQIPDDYHWLVEQLLKCNAANDVGSTKPRVTMVCSHCGSENVTSDATARWSVERQEWVLVDLLQAEDCEDCGGETRVKERPVEGGAGWTSLSCRGPERDQR